jgi:hypothetical protein
MEAGHFQDNIKEKIRNLEDLFDRNFIYKKIKIDNSYPRYILNNKKKFIKWIIE